MSREVVITGIGAVTSLGRVADQFFERLYAAESGASTVEWLAGDTANIGSQIGCEIDEEFTTHGLVDERNMGQSSQQAIVAAETAMTDAELWTDGQVVHVKPEQLGVNVSSPAGDIRVLEDTIERVEAGGRYPTRFLLNYLPNMPAGYVSRVFDARGPNAAESTACAAGTHSIARAVDDIRLGRADVVIAGGTSAWLSDTGAGGFDAMRALSTRNDAPTAASRPFDPDRDGFVLGDGAGIVVLEAAEHARDRGTDPYARVTGTGLTGDAEHPTRPPESGHGIRRAIENALADAGRRPASVDHINAHGTSTPRGDAHESTALNAVFETVPPVTSIKGSIGHTLGASGAIEAVVLAKTIASGCIPPTINHDATDSECNIPVVTEPTEADVEVAVSNSAGFGGTNGALVLERY